MSDFYSSFPCRKCGSIEKNTQGRCVTCARASQAKWLAKNKEKAHAASNAWRLKNIDLVRAQREARDAIDRDGLLRRKREYYLANKEKVNASIARWVAKNKDRYMAKGAEWREKNKDRKSQTNKAWKSKNQEALSTYKRNRRARELASAGVLSKDIDARLYKLQRGKCACCHLSLGTDYNLDHIVPLALGGSNTDDNVQLLRRICNLQKGAKDPIDFMQSRGLLL